MNKKNTRVVPAKFPFTTDDIAAMKTAEVFLRKWMQDIDDQLFREGYVLRDGVLFELKTNMPISSDKYRKRKRHH